MGSALPKGDKDPVSRILTGPEARTISTGGMAAWLNRIGKRKENEVFEAAAEANKLTATAKQNLNPNQQRVIDNLLKKPGQGVGVSEALNKNIRGLSGVGSTASKGEIAQSLWKQLGIDPNSVQGNNKLYLTGRTGHAGKTITSWKNSGLGRAISRILGRGDTDSLIHRGIGKTPGLKRLRGIGSAKNLAALGAAMFYPEIARAAVKGMDLATPDIYE